MFFQFQPIFRPYFFSCSVHKFDIFLSCLPKVSWFFHSICYTPAQKKWTKSNFYGVKWPFPKGSGRGKMCCWTLNRLCQSQTDFSDPKIFDPHFFLEKLLDLCQKMGISEKIPPPGPPGPPGGLLRGQTPQNKKIALLTKFLKEYFFSFMGSSRT